LAFCLLVGGRVSPRERASMKRDTSVVEIKVLNHWIIQKFAGEAILADVKPRYVVALLIANTKTPFQLEGTDVAFMTHRVAFFAVGSIVKVFAESDVIGKEYRLMIEQREIDGKKIYWLGVAD
jgi:hypothetical protein